MKDYLKPFLIVLLVVVFVYIFLQNQSFDQIKIKNNDTTKQSSFIKIKDKILSVEIADTDEQRTLGLSNRKFLLENNGMLFVFPVSGKYFFWMKDMNFPIDIIWFDENRKIVFIKEKASPDSFPELLGGESDSKYVLEVVSGFVEKNKIQIGDEFIFITD